ncbi:MAG: hypothetical protein IJZ26_03210 [Clostridia bacterium]|nr:hypothetical protein [Clostridia bacterium]
MQKTARTTKTIITSICAFLLLLAVSFCFVGCNSSLYTVNFDGNIDGEKYSVGKTTWEKSSEEGFEAVYTLKGEVPYNQDAGDRIYGGEHYNIALIRFTSPSLERVSYNESTQEGFYCEILNYGETEPVVKHGGFGSGNDTTKNTTYFLYQRVDDTIRTFTLKISFDGTQENERAYKFVIDPANYTLADAPAAA